MNASTPESPTYTEHMKQGRERWVHEDHLIDHRLTWLGLTQTLLFAAEGILIEKTPTAKKEALFEKLDWILPVVGFVSSALIYCGVLAATIAMVRIKKQHGMPDYGVSKGTTIGGWTSAIGLPFLFMWAWSRVIDCKFIDCGALDLVLAAIFIVTVIKWFSEFRKV